MIPRFCLEEETVSGDVSVRFTEGVDASVYYYLYNEIDKRVPDMKEDDRDIYHLESLVGGLLSNAIIQKRLCRDPQTKVWVILDE